MGGQGERGMVHKRVRRGEGVQVFGSGCPTGRVGELREVGSPVAVERLHAVILSWRCDCDGLPGELHVKIAGVRFRGDLGLEWRDQLLLVHILPLDPSEELVLHYLLGVIRPST